MHTDVFAALRCSSKEFNVITAFRLYFVPTIYIHSLNLKKKNYSIMGFANNTGKASNVVMRKAGEDYMDRSCEKRRSITYSQRGEEYLANNEKKEG